MADTQIESTAQASLLATFYVGDALCALDAVGVQEVIRVESVTGVRHAPPEVVGVMNLRGKIVTLLDPRIILGFGTSARTEESRVFIIEDRNEFLGILVDRAGEVVEVEAGHEEPPPINIPVAQSRFFQQVCRAGGRVVAVLNTRELLNESK